MEFNMHIFKGCLVVPVQVELTQKDIRLIQTQILKKVRETEVKGIILDISGMKIMDSSLSKTFAETIQMVKLMGAQMAISGMRPGIVASLIDLSADEHFNDCFLVNDLESGYDALILSAEQTYSKEKSHDFSEDSFQ